MDLKAYLQKGISFDNYYSQIKMESEGEAAPGSLNHFTRLNINRMERIFKSIRLDDEQINQLKNVEQSFDLIVITEGWCGDAAQCLPILDLMLRELKSVNVGIVYRDQNLDLMNQYLTNGGQAIPIVIGLDKENGNELFYWGPRPEHGKAMLKRHKDNPEEFPKDQFYKDLQKWYNKDKGKTIFQEFLNLFPKST